jgi:hypothetical protein
MKRAPNSWISCNAFTPAGLPESSRAGRSVHLFGERRCTIKKPIHTSTVYFVFARHEKADCPVGTDHSDLFRRVKNQALETDELTHHSSVFALAAQTSRRSKVATLCPTCGTLRTVAQCFCIEDPVSEQGNLRAILAALGADEVVGERLHVRSFRQFHQLTIVYFGSNHGRWQ